MLNVFLIVLRPVLDAWDQEFGGRRQPGPAPLPCDPVEPPPSGDPLVVRSRDKEEPASEPEVPVSEPVVVVEKPRVEEVVTALESQDAPPVQTLETGDLEEAAPAEPLYVRRGSGRGARYDVARPDASGERYRRRVVGGKAKYEPVRDQR